MSKNKSQRTSDLRWVALGDMHVTERAQRAYRPAHAEKLAATFNLEGMGYPVLSRHNGSYHIIDGQHRVAALRLLGFDPEDTIQCEVYEDLSEQGEAELFLERNTFRAPTTYDKFRVALTAKRQREVSVDQIVRDQGLHISTHGKNSSSDGGVRAVGTLLKIHDRIGPLMLGATLRIIRDAFGSPGFEQSVIEGVSFVVERYEGDFEEAEASEKLGRLHGGVNGLLGAAERLRLSSGNSKTNCIAAVTVDTINRGRRGASRLASWWES